MLALVKGSPSPGFRARPLAPRPRGRRDADPVGQRRAIRFPEGQQGEISGLSRCISNLGSSLGTAIAGTILVSPTFKWSYAAAMIALAVLGIVGLGAAMLLPRQRSRGDGRHHHG